MENLAKKHTDTTVPDFEICNAARLRKDPAYDGVFFTAVKTTRIYCRPVCPAPAPKTVNISFLPSAAACEHAGYRPCLRCRPETAPFSPAWNGTKTTVERALRLINGGALDDTDMESFAIDVDISLPALRVIRALDQIIEWRGKPKAIRCDNGSEYISHVLAEWAEKHDIILMFIQPGNPQQNAYVERYNRTVRYDWLNQNIFTNIEDAQLSATKWLAPVGSPSWGLTIMTGLTWP